MLIHITSIISYLHLLTKCHGERPNLKCWCPYPMNMCRLWASATTSESCCSPSSVLVPFSGCFRCKMWCGHKSIQIVHSTAGPTWSQLQSSWEYGSHSPIRHIQRDSDTCRSLFFRRWENLW